MTEKILLVPGANGTELLRTLARFGTNTLGLRVMNAAEFARFALMRSGIVPSGGFLPRKQEPAIIDGFIREIPYFASSGYADSEKIADAMYRLRSLIPDGEWDKLHSTLPRGEFPEKNQGLLTVYQRYLATLNATGNVDTVGLLRSAMEQAAQLSCEVYTLQEYPLTPLEQGLADRLAGKRISSSLIDLFHVPAAPFRNIDYTSSYGSSNEVEGIIDYIVTQGIPFDECTVAVADTARYPRLFYDFAQSHNLPVTFGCGVPILYANPARLLKLLYHWSTAGYFGVDALRELLHSDAFDRKKLLGVLGLEKTGQLEKVIDLAGQLRLSFDAEENRQKIAALPADTAFAGAVAALAEEFSLGQSKLIEKYAVIRKDIVGRVDRSALSVIGDALDSYARFAGESGITPIIPEILRRFVCSENSREGCLFVTGISGAMASMRKHLFIAGLSADNFPGAPRENYLLLDSDYLLFAKEDAAPTSIGRIQQNKNTLDNLLALASALDVGIHISYSNYDLAALKQANPSSVLYEIFKKQYGQEGTLQQYKKAIHPVGYFDRQMSDADALGRAYVQGMEIDYARPDFAEKSCAFTRDKEFSPTRLDEFFTCPYKFFLTTIMGIKEAEQDDPFEVISASALGTLAHSLMEELAHSPCDADAFSERADAAFDRFLLTRPPIHTEAANREKTVFRNMMKTAYTADPHNEVLASEEEQIFRHDTGILLKGYPDRVEKTPEGEYIIADYKTGKNIKHKPQDIDTCLQVVIYAYLMEQKGIPISGCEYRYLRYGITIPCRYDEDMKQQLNDKMLIFKEALSTGQFPATGKGRTCDYCGLKSLCTKAVQKEEETE